MIVISGGVSRVGIVGFCSFFTFFTRRSFVVVISAQPASVLFYPFAGFCVVTGVCVRATRFVTNDAVYHGQIALIAFHFVFLSPAWREGLK
jgi:hypothetical protein